MAKKNFRDKKISLKNFSSARLLRSQRISFFKIGPKLRILNPKGPTACCIHFLIWMYIISKGLSSASLCGNTKIETRHEWSSIVRSLIAIANFFFGIKITIDARHLVKTSQYDRENQWSRLLKQRKNFVLWNPYFLIRHKYPHRNIPCVYWREIFIFLIYEQKNGTKFD